MTSPDDRDLPAVTDDQLRQALTEIRPYTIVILKAGPKFEMPDPDRSSEVAKLIWAHGKRNYALRAAGVMPIVCPIADGSGVTGVCIFDTDPAEVEKIMDGDPGVQAGVFTYDVHPTRGFPGSALP